MPEDPSAEEEPGSDDEAEVVPSAVVVDLVKADGLAEDRNDEGDRRDEAVPQAEPEAGDFPLGVGRFLGGVRSGRAAPGAKHGQGCEDDGGGRFFHGPSSFSFFIISGRRTGVNIRREEARVDRPRPLPYTGFEEGTQAAEGKKTGVPFVSRTPRDARIMSDR